MKALGHEVTISAFYGLAGNALDWGGIQVLPQGVDPYGNDVILGHAASVFDKDPRAGWVVTLCDVWALTTDYLDQVNIAAWCPVDHDPVPPAVVRWFEQSKAVPIAMSRFGERKLAEAGFEPRYVPHAVDTEVYRPMDRDTVRQLPFLQLPESAFVVGMVAANVGSSPPRKAFGQAFQAFARFARKHGDALLYVHTDAAEPRGVDLHALAEACGIGDRVRFTGTYVYRRGLDASIVSAMYNAFDVLLNPSYGEGFGVPVVEAQATGTPVIVADNSAMTELCGSGWLVECDPYWDPHQKAFYGEPRIDSIVDCLNHAYHSAGVASRQREAREFALAYDAQTVTEQYWKPTLDVLAERMDGGVNGQTRQADGYTWVFRGRHTDDGIGPDPHEANLEPTLFSLLPEGGVFLDVGAHVGRWTIRLAVKAARVIAVEANPETADVLRRNLELNDVGNVEVWNIAAWDRDEPLRLHDPNGKQCGGSTRVLPDGHGVARGVRLDDRLADLDRLDLVKLDVEGADIQALEGMADTLRRLRPALFVELHHMYGYYKREDLEAVLARLGYTCRPAPRYLNAEYLIAET